METTGLPAKRRQIDVLLSKYAESHLHPTNELIHCVCVPAIVFSLLGLIWALHPLAAYAMVMTSLIYYFSLFYPFCAGDVTDVRRDAGCLAAIAATGRLANFTRRLCAGLDRSVYRSSYRRKKNLRFSMTCGFLLVGPLFVLGLLYRRLGISY